MRQPYHLSINAKLSLLAVSAASTALLLSSVAFVYNDVERIRSSTVRQLSALASVVGANSTAALQFDDPTSAEEMLQSLLQQPAVELAAIYDGDGQLFATALRPGFSEAPPTQSPAPIANFTDDGHLELAQTIVHDGRTVGTIYIYSTLNELTEQLRKYAIIVAVIFFVALAAAVAISSWLQRLIATPILALAETARAISKSRDFSVRIAKRSNDELGVLFDQFNAMLNEIERGEAELQRVHNDLERRVEDRTAQLSQSNTELSREVAERKRAEQELESIHHRLLATARRAGMAEIATGVLHNVGNVLNGINLSATLIADRLRQSKIAMLERTVDLLKQHSHDLGEFMTSDRRGKQIPAFLELLATEIRGEQRELVEEAESLTAKVSHVKAIVATQQSYAGVSGLVETFDITEALEDSIRLQSASFERHGITICRDFADIPPISLDKQKLLQILINLVKNAKDAMQHTGHRNTLTFRTRVVGERICVEVSDTGMGIEPKNLTRIFSHGFTTKVDGHGFGLHSCANAAQEMGGSLSASSDGPGKGATFVLELPSECIAKVAMA